jgi:2-polyprenyl-3-methyl-5-hydroxy-6-metoxy-1,4-benzoquinol methylase
MKGEKKDRYPSYIPQHYRLFLMARKVYRQTMVRQAERAARRRGPQGIIPDGPGNWVEPEDGQIPNPKHAINKSALWLDEDLEQTGVKEVAQRIETLKEDLKQKKLSFSTTAGTFLPRMYFPHTERAKLWENAWNIHHSGVQRGHRVLDVGGASTIFSFYLASMGCSVAVVDNDWNNCGMLYNSDYVAQKMRWDMKAYDQDVSQPLPFPDNSFDRVFSICVIEHLTSQVRRFALQEMARVLKPGGIAGFTTDYDQERKVLIFDKGLRFAHREKFEADVVRPSGLRIYDNTDWIDAYPDQNF